MVLEQKMQEMEPKHQMALQQKDTMVKTYTKQIGDLQNGLRNANARIAQVEKERNEAV